MGDDTYPTTLDKLALTLESARLAKSAEVAAEGIGEDLNLNLFAWTGPHLTVMAQLVDEPDDRTQRIEAVAITAQVLRSGWHTDSYTLLVEGFCALDRTRDVAQHDLARLFAQGDPGIAECLVATHVDAHHAQIALAPYTYRLGRIVEYHDTIVHPPADPHDGIYPRVLADAALRTDLIEIPRNADIFHNELARGLARHGMNLYWEDR